MIVTQICACGILMPSERARALQYAQRRDATRRVRGTWVQWVQRVERRNCDAAREMTGADYNCVVSTASRRGAARSRVYARRLLPAGGVGRCWTGGVLGNVHAVDSYCFVIGPCDRDALPSDAAPNIARRGGGRFIGNFPRPTSGFPRFSRSRGRDDACQRGAFPRSLSPGTRFCAFFFRPFCILFFFPSGVL